MAQFTRVNGDLKPVMWLDQPDYTNTGVNAVSSGLTVQPQGPKLEYFTVTFTGTGTTGAQVNATIQAIQQLATVYIYEYTDAANDTLAFAVYPTGAWTTAALVTALEASPGPGWANAVTVAASATFTN